MESIIQHDKACILCGWEGNLERHHVIYGTACRQLSEQDGLVVWLCPTCHRDYTKGVHGLNKAADLWLKQMAQAEWERCYGNREEFIARYGKSFI